MSHDTFCVLVLDFVLLNVGRVERGELLCPIQCDVREGRTEEEKQALAQEIMRVAYATIGPRRVLLVLIRETSGSHHVKAGEALPGWEAKVS